MLWEDRYGVAKCDITESTSIKAPAVSNGIKLTAGVIILSNKSSNRQGKTRKDERTRDKKETLAAQGLDGIL